MTVLKRWWKWGKIYEKAKFLIYHHKKIDIKNFKSISSEWGHCLELWKEIVEETAKNVESGCFQGVGPRHMLGRGRGLMIFIINALNFKLWK